MKQEIIITTRRDEIYHLTEEIHYHKRFENDVEVFKKLVYVGNDEFSKNGLRPIYKEDLSLLKQTNPHWFAPEYEQECRNFFTYNLPDDPNDVNLNNIIYTYSYNHSFFNINKEPIGQVFQGNYIEAELHNKKYKLEELRNYLLTKPEILKLSEIEDIPSYNANKKRNKCIYIQVYIDGETIKKMNEEGKEWYEINYLNMNQFLK